MYYKTNYCKYIYLGLLCFYLGQGALFAQHKNVIKSSIKERISIGVFLNHTLLRGDAYGLSSIGVNKEEDISDAFDLGVGLSSLYHFNSNVYLGLDFNFGKISGTKQWETNIPKSVWTVDGQYFNVGFTGGVNFSNIIHKRSPIKFKYYTDLFLGYSTSWGDVLNITESNDERTSYKMPLTPLFGLGFGVGYPINKHINLDLGTRILFSTSDDFDGINEDVGYNAYNDAFWVTRFGLFIKLSAFKKASKDQNNLQLSDPIKEIILVKDTSTVFVYDTVRIERDTVPPLYQESLFFDVDKYELTLEHRYKLQTVLKVLENNSGSTILITGFTDSTGSIVSNNKLSNNRVQSVYDWLEYRNVNTLRITTNYHGEFHLPYNSHSENRRVNIVILPYQTDEYKAKSKQK